MRRDSLLAFFRDYISAPKVRDEMFVVHDDGFRTRRWTYGQVADAAEAFATRLRAAGFKPGDKIVLWGENRGEWIAALWATRLTGVVAVPVDFRASAEQAHRIREIVQARVMLVGAEVKPEAAEGFAVWRMDDANSWNPGNPRTEPGEPMERVEPKEPLAEIIFTSGATSEPKGVTLTDKNILANINAIEEEIAKYRKYLRPVAPIRFLNLLPLSHMFGQSMATFIPPMVAGTVVFSNGYNPQEVVRQIKRRRISVLVCVPKVLDVLREHVSRSKTGKTSKTSQASKSGHWLRRWWMHREVHGMFGWKFWCIVVGGAPLEPALEEFWRERGFLVIQGYGLTETAPVVTLNHPFKKPAAGTVGTAISGVEIRIAGDGEVLVRGDNVTTGYYDPSTTLGASAPSDAFRDGWFHTGDIGALDAEGRLTIKGRKKEMIVTANGLNVYPEDVERALNAQPGVQESAVVGVIPAGGAGREERVHAVLVLATDMTPARVVKAANATLEDHQRVWSWSVWHGHALPRTEGTRKLKRKDIQRWAQSGAEGGPAAAAGRSVEEIVSAALGGRAITRETTFDELGLGSLDRVQLLARIEEAFNTSIDELSFAAAKTVGDLATLVEQEPGERRTEPRDPMEPVEPVERVVPQLRSAPEIEFPRWNRSWPARAVRRVSMPTWVLAVSRPWMSLTVEGLENLERLDHPVIFAPNHQSHMDTPAILQALPNKWRYRVAPAMAKEWFKAHFFPRDYPISKRIPNSASYYAASLFYNCFPIPQYEGGTRQTIRYIGTLFDQKHSLLIFPEGKRTEYGEINVFRPGVGMIAAKLGVPVVPVRIEGLDKVLHLSASWPTRGPARITFGKPMRLEGSNYAELAAKVRDAVVALQPYSGPDAGSVAQYLSEQKGKGITKA